MAHDPVNMDREVKLKKAEKLLCEVLENKTASSMAIEEWPVPDKADFSLLESAKWQLIYITNDADIRSKDHEYEATQFDQLRKFLENIQQRIRAINKS